MKKFAITLILILISLVASAQQTTIAQQIQRLQTEHKVHFVYDATLDLSKIYNGESLEGQSLGRALKQLFADTNLTYEKRGKNIILKKTEQKEVKATNSSSSKVSELKRAVYQLRGRVQDDSGETLVNASVYDITSGKGMLTDEHGYFSLFLTEGNHKLQFSYVGCEDFIKPLNINGDQTINITLVTANMVDEVEILGDMNSRVLTTQTGKRTLTQNDINTEFSALSSPDLVKTLQHISGITSGVELTSDLYVHGGNGDENLYLIDGTPLYHTNHTFGLFSSFNTDIIKNVDFYKSGFPARYSGRVSSIIDVRTKDGNMNEHHGSVSVGLLDGRLHFEGPIVKDKVSYNIGLRRSWMDALTRTLFHFQPKADSENSEIVRFNYFFYDLNAKVTWRKDERNTLWMSLYRGTDELKVEAESGLYSRLDDLSHMKWGKTNATFCWDAQLNERLSLSTALIGTFSNSLLDIEEDDYEIINNVKKRNSFIQKYNTTDIYDLGVKADARFTPCVGHQVRFGGAMMHHGFHPQTKHQVLYFGDPSEKVDTTLVRSSVSTYSNELTLYAEDELNLTNRFSLNIGSSYTMMMVKDKTYHLLDPRMAMKYQLGNRISAKMSVTHMSQSLHRISSSLLSLPTDFWVPTTATFHPTTSWQYAAGLYAEPNSHWSLSMEGFYKNSFHLLQYRNWMGIQPSAANWDQDVVDGQGRSYGVELDAAYHNSRLTLSGAYTLSWSKRKFDEFYDGWFYSQFDNRHKVDLSMRYKLSKKVSMTAAWNYHSGNRITLPVAYGYNPILPDGDYSVSDGFIYDKPNNCSMPAYHRLDLGFDFRHTTKKGRERIWNLSIYNAYCRMNAIYVSLDTEGYLKPDNTWDYKIKATKYGYIPIIPSLSYTYKF